jgi:predicted RNase H-like HicB family nuclease
VSKQHEYTVVYEKGPQNWSAYSPDVPGCVAAAETREELEVLFREALEFHLEGLIEDGEPLPEPTCETGKVLVRV